MKTAHPPPYTPVKTVNSYSPPPHKDTYGAPAHPKPVVHQGGHSVS